MAYLQVDTLLDEVESFHHKAAQLFARLSEGCDCPRAVMLLEYLAEHQRSIESAIAQSRPEIPARVLKTWITTTQKTSRVADSVGEVVIASQGLTADDVIEMAMKLDGRVIDVYQELVNRNAPAWVTELFQNLLDMERQQEKQMVTQAERGADL